MRPFFLLLAASLVISQPAFCEHTPPPPPRPNAPNEADLEKAARAARKELRDKHAAERKAAEDKRAAFIARKTDFYDHSKSFMDYLQKMGYELKINNELRLKWVQMADEIFKAEDKDPRKYLPLNYTSADKLLGNIITVVALREKRSSANKDTAAAGALSALGYVLGPFFADEPEKAFEGSKELYNVASGKFVEARQLDVRILAHKTLATAILKGDAYVKDELGDIKEIVGDKVEAAKDAAAELKDRLKEKFTKKKKEEEKKP